MASATVERAYRNARREGIPARAALIGAKARKRGMELAFSDNVTDRNGCGDRQWTIDIAPGMRVVVQQVPDNEACDCWEWAKENPRDDGQEDDIPEHGHFGIVATLEVMGQEKAHESCWGFIWDWPGQDDYAELAYAWDDIAAPVIDDARKMAATMPAWVAESIAIRTT